MITRRARKARVWEEIKIGEEQNTEKTVGKGEWETERRIDEEKRW